MDRYRNGLSATGARHRQPRRRHLVLHGHGHAALGAGALRHVQCRSRGGALRCSGSRHRAGLACAARSGPPDGEAAARLARSADRTRGADRQPAAGTRRGAPHPCGAGGHGRRQSRLAERPARVAGTDATALSAAGRIAPGGGATRARSAHPAAGGSVAAIRCRTRRRAARGAGRAGSRSCQRRRATRTARHRRWPGTGLAARGSGGRSIADPGPR